MTGFHSDGFKKSTDGLDRFMSDVAAKREAGLDGIGLTLEAQIKNKLSTPGRGAVRWGRVRTSTRSRRRRSVTARMIARAGRASAPGDPPAPDTGALRNSIRYRKEGGVRTVGTDQIQAPALEFGTRRAGRQRRTTILPRPFMRPALNETRQAMGIQIAAIMKFKR